MSLPSRFPVILDVSSTSAALGLRFWDSVTRQTVSDGLAVVICPMQDPGRRLPAISNRSGIFVFQRLPRLKEIEIASGTASPFWTAPVLKDGTRAGFTVEVRDAGGRFLPFQFPVTELVRGAFNWECAGLSPLASPLETPFDLPFAGIPLFSSPSRPVPGGMAVVRADLRQAGAKPASPGQEDPGFKASWAFLEVFYKGKPAGRGLADQDGRVAVILPYPRPALSSSASGMPGSPLPLNRQSWKIDIEAHYAQPVKPQPASANAAGYPDLCTVLSSPKVTLRQPVCPTSPPGTLTLNFGQETVIQTSGRSELFFTNP